MGTFRPFTNLAERRHRLPEAGRIRLGAQVQTKNGKTRPSSLRTLRFTSPNRDSIDMLAKLYGGEVKEWEGQWEVITDAAEVPVILPTEDPLGDTPLYELWSRGGLSRRCDGETAVCPVRVADDEVAMQSEPCICNARKVAECKVTVRLSVILPEVPFAGTWRLETHSWNAAEELPGMVEAVREFTSRGFVRAFLGLRAEEKMELGKKKEFVVPYLRVESSVNDALAGAGALAAIPAGPEPAALEAGDPMVSFEEAKARLLAVCGGDRVVALRLWHPRGKEPISLAELRLLEEEACNTSLSDDEPVDAEVEWDDDDPARPFT